MTAEQGITFVADFLHNASGFRAEQLRHTAGG